MLLWPRNYPFIIIASFPGFLTVFAIFDHLQYFVHFKELGLGTSRVLFIVSHLQEFDTRNGL